MRALGESICCRECRDSFKPEDATQTFCSTCLIKLFFVALKRGSYTGILSGEGQK